MQEMLLLASMIAGSTVWIMTKLARIERCIYEMKQERWTVNDMRHWVEQLGSHNEEIQIPSVSNVVDRRQGK